jgi:thiamine-phosphate pyrophosphorylase
MTAGPRAAAERRLRGLHVLADDAPHWKWDPLAQARAACCGGAAVVQLRAKHAGDREALDWALRIRALTREAGALFVVNDRFDLALAADADGVHLGQDDLPPARIPARLRERLLVGRSTHTPAQIAQARAEAVDYLAFGPIFASPSKPSAWPAQGVAALAELVRRVAPQPLVAIGGIDVESAAEVARSGAGVAVISAVAGAQDPEAAVRALAAQIEAARA